MYAWRRWWSSNEAEQNEQPQWRDVCVHKHLLLRTDTNLKMTNFFSAGLQLCICSGIKYSFIFMHTAQGLGLNRFDYGKSINGSEWLRCSRGGGGGRARVWRGESCEYNGVNAKQRAADTHSSFINALHPEAVRYGYVCCPPDLKPLWKKLQQL